ncbi:AGE family epimerase/isomerase [Poseidonocella sedimentorum]|uniref:Mannose-6-phosphate isomerase n=1 Tax=Poseidonocella sedimentorum TaxID=871652 RepID=A0A1I6ED68_9RHOB|nr:AGE family epimerase/isomerase [Poseidonocella sedimentorum]SFR15607.1 mannose-6-phosphate isomerase [Poseidonocella sedimentorum]
MPLSPDHLSTWITGKALPLWTGVGIDAATGTCWTALDHAGAPCVDMARRMRVQTRQAYCFAQSDLPAHRALALQLFRFSVDHGFDPETGNLVATTHPDLSVLSAPHDLYDMAFTLLAASALIEAGAEISADLARLEAELARLDAPRGWYEDAAQAAAPAGARRRQNPHMHMFEATTALWRATGEARFAAMADKSLGLFRDVFLQPDGRVFEYFDLDWRPVDLTEQAVEPGHMVEWVYLLDQWEKVSGTSCGVDLRKVFEAARGSADAAGTALPDTAMPLSEARRCWPQTEFLKAAVSLRARGALAAEDAELPEAILAALWADYVDVEVPGGWYDSRRVSDRALLSDRMPASTFYHLFMAFQHYIAERSG